MSALFETVLKHVPAHDGDPEAPLQFQVSALDYSTFVGRIAVGRINAGTLKPGMDVLVMEGPDGKQSKGRVNQVLCFEGPGPGAGGVGAAGRYRADQRH